MKKAANQFILTSLIYFAGLGVYMLSSSATYNLEQTAHRFLAGVN